MHYLSFGVHAKSTSFLQSKQHVRTNDLLLALKEGCLIGTLAFYIPIEIIDNLTNYSVNFLYLIQLCFLEQTLILTKYRFNCSFEYIRFFLRFVLGYDGHLLDSLGFLALLFLFFYFLLYESDY